MLLICQWFLAFLFYSFAGWAYETVLCSVRARRFINRGFLSGPICPIYGVGAVTVIWIFSPLHLHPALLFILSAAVDTAIEYVTAVVLEKLFHTKWWDYSHYRFNFQGRISLLGAVVFGTMSVLLIEYIHPPIERLVRSFPHAAVYICSAIGLMLLITDIVVTVVNIIALNGKLQEIQQQFTAFIDANKKRAEDLKTAFLERFENSEFNTARIRNTLNRPGYQIRRLISAFPQMKPIHNLEAFEKIRERLKLTKGARKK